MSGYDDYNNYRNPSDDDYDYYNNSNHNNSNSTHQHQHHPEDDPYTSQYQDPYHDYHGYDHNGGAGGGGMTIPIPNNEEGLVGVNMNNQYHNHDILDDENRGIHGIHGENDDININNNNHDGHSNDDPTDDVNDMIDFDNDPDIANLPRILMMGPRRGGKTSIQRVVFHKMSPHETLFRLEANQSLERSVVDHTPLCRFTIWDFPGDYYGPENGTPNGSVSLGASPSSFSLGGTGSGGMGMGMGTPSQQQQQFQQQQSRMMRQLPVHANNANDIQNEYANQQQKHQQQQILQNGPPGTIITGHENSNHHHQDPNNGEDEGDIYVFGKATALIFVLDAQDEPYDHVLQHFTETVKRAARINPHIAIEVFINKVDGELFLSDEAKYDCRRDVMQQVTDELADAGVMPDSVPISYHLTSIYDHSVFEAFSRVVQKLIPQLQPTLENLLNVLVSTCAMEKAYLFDVASKLYISTDSSPVDMQSVELCSDMIDCVLDVSGIYGLAGGSADNNGSDDHDDEDNDGDEYNNDSDRVGANSGHEIDSLIAPPGSLNSSDPAYLKNIEGKVNDVEGVNNMGGGDDFGNDVGTLDYGNDGNDELVGTLISQSAAGLVGSEEKEVEADSAYDSESASVIRLSKGMVSKKS